MNTAKDIRPIKKLGQNFLTSKNVIEKIILSIKENIPKNNFGLIEIGPGKGAITYGFKENEENLVLIEKDSRLIGELKTNFRCKEIINEDVLKINFDELIEKYFKKKEIIIFGNLPYNIATKLILNFLLNTNPNIKTLVFMVQKEVAQRLTAKTKTKEYGSLSIIADALSNTQILFDISKNNFYPVPKVTSSLIEIKKVKKIKDEEIEKLLMLTKRLFQNRRKMIKKTIYDFANSPDEAKSYLGKINLNESMRPEELSYKDIIGIIRGLKI